MLVKEFFCLEPLKWGEEMQSFLWAIGSLVILVPLIYFLPLGISLRGKWLVIIISFILGLTGLLAKGIFPLWKTILMLLLLLGIVVYFIDKKLGGLLFLPEGSSPGKDEDYDPQMEEIEDWEISEIQVEKFSTKEELKSLTEDNPEISKDDNFIEPISEPVLPTVAAYMENESEQLKDWNEDISFIQNRNQLLEAKDDFIEEMDLTPKENPYETEFEELLNRELVLQTIDGVSENNQSDTDTETISEYFNSLVEENKLDKEDLTETNLDNVFMDLNEGMLGSDSESGNEVDDAEVQLAEKIFDLNTPVELDYIENPVGDQVNQELSVSEISKGVDEEEQLLEGLMGSMPTTNTSVEEVEEKEEEFINNVVRVETEEAAIEETSEIGISDPEELEDTNTNIGQDVVHKELLHTMVSQLEIISKKADPMEYEKLIKEHMHERLPVYDYYTFASLLITHYIRKKKFDELEKLISSISSKVKGYAILEQELEYIYNRYCKRTV